MQTKVYGDQAKILHSLTLHLCTDGLQPGGAHFWGTAHELHTDDMARLARVQTAQGKALHLWLWHCGEFVRVPFAPVPKESGVLDSHSILRSMAVTGLGRLGVYRGGSKHFRQTEALGCKEGGSGHTYMHGKVGSSLLLCSLLAA